MCMLSVRIFIWGFTVLASFYKTCHLSVVNALFILADILELQRVAFIPVANATRLVKANVLFARLTINLSPFAFELPSGYLSFVKIL